MRRLWGLRSFRLLLIGQSVSALGDWMGTIGFMALSLALTGSALAVGIVLVLRLLPAMVAGPLATRLVLRLDRRRTMLAMDLARAGVAGAVPLVNAIWWVYLCALLLELGGVAFLPARDSSIPDLVGDHDDRQLSTANGLVLASSYGTIPLGAAAFAGVSSPLSGQHLLAHGGVAAVFWLDALTFVVSFACIRPLRELGRTTSGNEPAGTTADRGEGEQGRFLAAFHIPLVRVVAPLAFAVALGLGALFSLGIVFVRSVLHADDTSFSLLVALFGVGAGLGLVSLRVLGSGVPRMGFVRLCITGQGVVIAGMSLAPALWLTDLGALAFAFFTALSLATAMGILQDALGGGRRVQGFAVFHVLIRSGLALAAVGAALAADMVRGVRIPLVGTLPPVRLVLCCSGLFVALVPLVLRERFVAGARLARRTRPTR